MLRVNMSSSSYQPFCPAVTVLMGYIPAPQAPMVPAAYQITWYLGLPQVNSKTNCRGYSNRGQFTNNVDVSIFEKNVMIKWK